MQSIRSAGPRLAPGSRPGNAGRSIRAMREPPYLAPWIGWGVIAFVGLALVALLVYTVVATGGKGV